MADSASLIITGDKKLSAQFAALDDAVRGQTMKNAAVAGALLIVNEWKATSPYETGNYRRSQHVGGEGVLGGIEGDTTGTDIGGQEIGADFVEVKVGSNVEYGPRLEFGFTGTDALGRTYHQPARPSLRSAVESQKGAVEREVGDAIHDLLKAAV